ncbi:MAG: hypothetical protein QM756_39385 [Polyangiaceae bacterium]
MAYLNDNPKIPIAAMSLAALRQHVGPVTPVAGTRDDNALIVEPGDHRRQVWVKPGYSGYRGAWRHVHVHIPAQMDVDHIFNRARASALGYEYVRLFLCLDQTNQRHGAFLERRLTRIERSRTRIVPHHDMLFASNWTIAKMAGIPIDRQSPTYNQHAALEWLNANNFI